MMHEFSSWVQMGGYAGFVWLAYGLVVSAFVLTGWRAKRARRLQLRKLKGDRDEP